MRKCYLVLLMQVVFVAHLKAQSVWTVLNSTVTVDLLKVQCLSDDTLFIFGDNGVLLKSTDGGNNFTVKQNSIAAIYTSGFFINMDTGFAATGTGNLIRTYDGGDHWIIVNSCGCFIEDVCFSNEAIGLCSDLSGLSLTDDGGDTWQNGIVGSSSSTEIVAVGDSVFLSIKYDKVHRIADAGLSIISQTVNTISNASLTGISFIDSQNGYTVSTDGNIFRTTDQGLNWSHLLSNTIINVNDIDFVDSLHGFMIVGPQRNNIYKSIDGGHNWMLDYVASDPIESITHFNGSAYVCGQNGLVLKKQVSLVNIEETDVNSLSIQLNSSNDLILVTSKRELAGKQYRIFSVNGQLVINKKLLPGQNEIDISSVHSGGYILEIDGFNGMQFSRIKN